MIILLLEMFCIEGVVWVDLTAAGWGLQSAVRAPPIRESVRTVKFSATVRLGGVTGSHTDTATPILTS